MVPGEAITPYRTTVQSTPIPFQRPQSVVNEIWPKAAPTRVLHQRVREIAFHIPWYGFKTQSRLAKDTQVVPSTISRLLRGKESPSLVVALRLTEALSKRLGHSLDVREVFSLDGSYPTPSVCVLMQCRGCLPPQAFDQEDNLIVGFQGIESGQWSLTTAAKGDQ